MLTIETGMVLAFCLIALANPSLGSRWFDRLEQSFSALGRRRGLSVALVGFATLGLRLTLLPLFPVPEPIVHDEYSYLLTADTVAHGRLTNTTHLMWEHFETFDEIQQPTYCSKYFPAQGFFLALGRIVFGHPYWGVWLSSGLMCAAITWMLQGWMPPEWALLGGLLVMLRVGVVGYWADSYWGGAVAAAGGALVLGALPRIKSSQHMRDALLMGIGLGILASSRPYEGLIFSLPIAILLLSWMLARSRSQFKVSLYRIILLIVLVLGVTCAGLGYYSWRTTGAPFRMPYSVATQTYSVAPIMLWQHLRPVPDYHHEVMRKVFTGEEVRYFQAIRSPGGFLLKLYFLFFSSWRFYFGLLFVLPLWMLALALPRNFSWHNVDRSTRTLLLVLASFASGLALATYYSPHYSAPVAGLIWALMLRAMRKVRGWNASGRFVMRAIPLVCVLAFALRVAAVPLHIPLTEFYEFAWYQKARGSYGRGAVQSQLQNLPGTHLVMVRYHPDHEAFREWVFNDADIDRSKIVWAREMSPPEDKRLLDYFRETLNKAASLR